MQGCTIGCKGCFNAHTWSKTGGKLEDIYKLAWRVLDQDPEGITISGGEPTEQWEALKGFLKECHKRKPGLNVLMFSGVSEDQLEQNGILKEAFSPYYMSNALVSTIVSGPYERDNPSDQYLLGSANQKILTWNGVELEGDGPRVEVHVDKDGTAKVTGFPSKEVIKHIKTNFR